MTMLLGARADYSVPREARLPGANLVEALHRMSDRGEDAIWPLVPKVRSLAERVEVIRRAPKVEIVVGGVGPHGVRVSGPQLRFESWYIRGLECDRCGAYADCEHIFAVVAGLMWHHEELGPAMRSSPWRRALEPLLAGEPEPTEDTRARGHIRAVVRQDGAGELLEGGLSIMLVPYSKRGGAPLKPRKAPRSLDAIERRVRELSEGDRALCRVAEQWQLMRHLHTYRALDSTRVADELGRLEAQIVTGLHEVTELFIEDQPLQASHDPWRPELVVEDAGKNLRVSLGNAVTAFRAGHVIDDSPCLRPIAASVEGKAVSWLLRSLPVEVPPEEMEDFVSEFLVRAPVDAIIATERLGCRTGRPTPHLYLGADGERLTVDLRFTYGDVRVPAQGPPMVALEADMAVDDAVEAQGFVQRDTAAEAEAMALLERHLPVPYPAPLEGDEAYDFLLDGLPHLEAEWDIYLEPSLRARRPRGTLETHVGFRSGVDWFDLELDFEVDGAQAAPAAVLKTWAEGRRYVTLADGSLAKVPEDWLRRHGETAAQLAEIKGRKKTLPAHAAPIAADLLEEARGRGIVRWRELAERIQKISRVPERDPPAGLRAELRDYQHRGYRWLCFLRELGLGGVLADDMGLGKTVQTLAMLLEAHAQPGGQTLIVAPTSVIHNWMLEAQRFTPDLKLHLHYGGKRPLIPEDVDLVVTSYALLRIDQALLTQRKWRCVVLDEAQHIKNPDSQVAKAARRLDAKWRLAVSGTPLENHLLELWSIFHFLMPGFFGTQAAFRRRFLTPIQKHQDETAMRALQERLKPFVLRRLKAEVASELPPRTEQVLYCELGPGQRRLYELVRDTWRESVLGRVEEVGVERSTIQILEALMRLRQACCDPRLLPMPEARQVQESAKLSVLRELLGEAIEEGHRALVFSQWPSLLKLAAAELTEMGYEYLYLDGGTRDRGRLQERWNDPEGAPVFFISLKAGGTGLNLTGADYVVHLDPWWNPQAEQQATDRAHRIGQTRPVMVYKLVAKDTCEEQILALQARKKALFDAAIDADRLQVDRLSAEDLAKVFN